MIRSLSFVVFLFVLLLFSCKKTSRTRVETAYDEKQKSLQKQLSKKGIDFDKLHLFLRAFKQEEVLEVWAKKSMDTTFQLLLTYPFCNFSGGLGPKRKEGDLQIPEGVYYIDRFNPQSTFYLSLGLNYPNLSDKKRSDQQKPGSDIFIHGGCATVGCIPITNDKIKGLYLLATQASKSGQTLIPVHIFPTRMTDANMQLIKQTHPIHASFWKELKPIYQQFEQTYMLPDVQVDARGAYQM